MSSIFTAIAEHGHEQVVFCQEPSCGYRAIIAIHDTTLGPALGGTRFWNYPSDHDAIVDALRLARGMTYKAAVAGLNLGGGKAVIIGDNRTTRREAIFRAHGRFIQSLGGRYITAEDVGTTVTDMDYIHMETNHVTGLPGASGDPSPVTAYGTYQGMRAAARVRFGSESLAGMKVAVQGIGSVGYHLCQHLAADGARLIVTDLDADRVQQAVREFDGVAVAPDEIYDVDVEIYAPCALGATVDDRTVPRLKAVIIAGAANNVLAEPRHGDLLHERGILYAPDYVINAGGVINVYGELKGWSKEQSMRKAGEIHTTLLHLFELAQEEGLPTYRAADRIAEKRMAEVRNVQKTWL